MARCAICDKATVFGNNVSHSIRRTSRTWKPNIRKVRAIVDGTPMTISVCTRCLRSNKVVRNVRGAIRPHATPSPEPAGTTAAAALPDAVAADVAVAAAAEARQPASEAAETVEAAEEN